MKIKLPSHLKKRFRLIEKLEPVDELPKPWGKPSYIAVGGLTDIGFQDNSDLLVCISSAGRGVIDCLKCEKVARDPSMDFDFDQGNLLVEGIGNLQGCYIKMAGLSGGGLPSGTYDGWTVERHPFAYPNEQLIVASCWQSILSANHDEKVSLYKLTNFITPLIAYGYSPTGNSFVVATSSDLIVYTRN